MFDGKYECRRCGELVTMEGMLSGDALKCPACGARRPGSTFLAFVGRILSGLLSGFSDQSDKQLLIRFAPGYSLGPDTLS